MYTVYLHINAGIRTEKEPITLHEFHSDTLRVTWQLCWCDTPQCGLSCLCKCCVAYDTVLQFSVHEYVHSVSRFLLHYSCAVVVFPMIDLSVRPFVTCVYCDKTKETSAHILIPYQRLMHQVLWHEEWLMRDVPFYLKFWAKLTHPFKNGDFQSIFIRSDSAVTLSEKS